MDQQAPYPGSIFFEQKVLSIINSPLKFVLKSASKIAQLRKNVPILYKNIKAMIVIKVFIQEENKFFLAHKENLLNDEYCVEIVVMHYP